MKRLMLLLILCCQFTYCGFCNAQLEKEVQLGLSHVLSMGGIADDLGMSGDDRFHLGDVWLMTEMKLRSEFQKFDTQFSETLPVEEQEELKAELKDAIAAIRDNELVQIKKVLSDKQVDRLRQIRFQYLQKNGNGFKSLKDELELTDEQLEKVKSIQEKLQREIREMRNSGQKMKISRDEIAGHIKVIRGRLEDELVATLTGTQRAKLNQLQGKTFEFQYGPKPAKGGDASENSDEEVGSSK